VHNVLPFLFISAVIAFVYSTTVEKSKTEAAKSGLFLFVTLVLSVGVGSALLLLLCVYK